MILEQYQFEKYFKHLLFDHKKLVIPGLGTFFLDRLPASMSSDRLQISPPSYHLRFEKDMIQKDNESASVLRNYYPGTTDQAFEDYSRLLVERLLNRGQIKIDDLGRLHLNEGEIIYEKNLDTQNMLTRHLPILTMTHLKSIFPPVPPVILSRIGSLSAFWTRWLPFLIAGFLTLGVAGLSYKINQTKIHPKPGNEAKPPLITDTISNQTQTDTGSQADVEGDVKDTIVKSVEDAGLNKDGVMTKKCIIITGAYRTRMYKNVMIRNLEARGLKVFTETSPTGLTRVGFEFECAETELKSYLDSIRSAIQKDAWYLIPDFSKKQG